MFENCFKLLMQQECATDVQLQVVLSLYCEKLDKFYSFTSLLF